MLLLYIILASVLVIAVAVAVDVTTAYFAERQTVRMLEKQRQEFLKKRAEWMLTIANLGRNAAEIYKRPEGAHRYVRVS